jgi:hypothetical protein
VELAHSVSGFVPGCRFWCAGTDLFGSAGARRVGVLDRAGRGIGTGGAGEADHRAEPATADRAPRATSSFMLMDSFQVRSEPNPGATMRMPVVASTRYPTTG